MDTRATYGQSVQRDEVIRGIDAMPCHRNGYDGIRFLRTVAERFPEVGKTMFDVCLRLCALLVSENLARGVLCCISVVYRHARYFD